MIFRRLSLNKIKYSQIRYKHKSQILKMNTAYLRHSTEEEKFELTFQYVEPQFKVNREFNFSRQISESVNTFTQRVAANINKVVKKKMKHLIEDVVSVSVSVDGSVVSDETTRCKEVFCISNQDKVTLFVCDNEYKVLINSPWISTLLLPNSILAGFFIYPSKFEHVYTDKKMSKFYWHKSRDKDKNWSLIGEGFMHCITNSEIGHFIKLSCLPRHSDYEGPVRETVSNVEVEAGPGFCPFENRHQFTKERCSENRFRVVSYNILADLYCDSDFTRDVLHPYCPAYALMIDYRKQIFIKEIRGYNADIICLQEVDRQIYTHDLQPIFEQLGYDSNFCQKRGDVAEGLACLYTNKKFKLLESFRIVLSDELNTNSLFSDIWRKVQENELLSERILTRASVLQVLVLESFDMDEIILVGNTHLYFHPDADHIRLLQGGMVIRFLEHALNDARNKYDKRVSLILSGDFNSVPTCGVYQLYTVGSVQEDHIDFQSKPTETTKVALKQSVPLKSACGTPKYTNFTTGFADCLDYIFYESSNFEMVQVIPFPSLEELQQHTALPSIVFPSDHIALIADLTWT